ncbi:MAG TPA: winged helix DNA-binding domain-containing protein [Herpetosiphonaceae bacterium]|nr:winged helix DNA-binding domain-containing protein [Herpetosiphonaceae bacterium]
MTIAHQRLANQGLSTSPFADPGAVTLALGALQAQDYAGAKWAIGLRMPRATDASISQAYAEGTLLRTHLLRPTWHFVNPADIHWLLALTAPRVHARNATYYRRLEIDADVIRRSAAALALAARNEPNLTREAVRAALEASAISTAGPLRLSYLLMHLELDGVICSGTRVGNQHTYALLDERVPEQRRHSPADPAGELARRFFLTRGPASAQDFAKWSGLTLTAARRGLEAARDCLQRHAGQDLWGPAPAPTSPPAALLLSIYDEYISSYGDRSAMVAPQDAARLQALGNDLTGIVVLDGQVAGTWKRTLARAGVAVTPDLFRQLSPAEQAALELAIDRYAAFVELPRIPAPPSYE